MRYLLDVNILMALGLPEHEWHHRVIRWLKPPRARANFQVATCSITELAFIRILAQPAFRFSVAEAKVLLRRLKSISGLDFAFLTDAQTAGHLPDWVMTSKQVRDGHLSELARAHGAVLATLDGKITGAFLLPD
jgi:predicted nucleic acid-binding protein